MADGSQSPSTPPLLHVRKMGFSFAGMSRAWFGGNRFVTHSANALNMVFPAGERFFVRSVRHYLPQITEPALRARVRGFFGQEGSHGHEHERVIEVLREQGYEIDAWLRWYERFAYGTLEKIGPPSLRLSVTTALEHLTASMAEVALTRNLLDAADPRMRDLLRWHAAEEIEHRSVAFDVFEQVDGRYWMRVLGMAVATAALLGFWRSGTQMLLRQEEGYGRADVRRDRKAAREKGHDTRQLFFAIMGYLRPSFHPDDSDTDELARDYLQRIGRLDG